MATNELSLQIHILLPSVPKPISSRPAAHMCFRNVSLGANKSRQDSLLDWWHPWAWHRLLPCRDVDKPTEWGRRKYCLSPPIKRASWGGFFLPFFQYFCLSDTNPLQRAQWQLDAGVKATPKLASVLNLARALPGGVFCSLLEDRGKSSIAIRDSAHVLAGVLASVWTVFLGLLAWAEVFGLMRMLRTAAAVPAHAQKRNGHFVAHFLSSI